MRHLPIILLFAANGLFARPIGVNVHHLFGSAKFVGEVVITGYNGRGKIYFQSTQFKDTINSADCRVKVRNGIVFPPGKDHWMGNLPFIGDTVLILVDGYNNTPVFGSRIGRYYRLWSSIHNRSLASFSFESPVLPLDDKRFSDSGNTTSCRDGCLVPIDQLSSLIETYQSRVAKKVESVNIAKYKGGEALAIFYDETLKLFNGMVWSNKPFGKSKTLTLTYSNGKALEIIFVKYRSPKQPRYSRSGMEKFRWMDIQEIRWVK